MTRRDKARSGLRPWAFIGYFLLVALAAAIAIATWDPDMRVVDVEALFPGFYTHVSNLLISCGLILAYGLIRLVSGAKLREVAIFTLAVIAANYIYEVFLTLYNTKDLVDAHYGAAASLVTFAFLAAVKSSGLTPAATHGRAAERRDSDALAE